MRALIRGKEVMTEPFSPWVQNNLAFLTGTEVDSEGNPLPGDGWTLVDNYVPPEPVEGSEEPQPIQSTPVEEKPAEQPAVRSGSEDVGTQSPSEALPETVSIGGKEYTLDELKKLIE